MAFYHFLALFPALLILLAIGARVPSIEPLLKSAITGLGRQFLPDQASSLLQQMLNELASKRPAGLHLLSALAGACWASLNGTWALIYGLNNAYELEENRPKWKLGITIAGLMVSLATTGACALLLLSSAQHIEVKALLWLEWLMVIAVLMLTFAVVYRFAPDLRDHEWSWSTPGAVCALVLWIGATMLLRLYFRHVNDDSRDYGHLNSVVMLLLWLYLTNGAILIGGEVNSEIEKAAKQKDAPGAGS